MTAAKNRSCRIKENDKEKNGSQGKTAMNRIKEKRRKRKEKKRKGQYAQCQILSYKEG